MKVVGSHLLIPNTVRKVQGDHAKRIQNNGIRDTGF